jgi:hypothetical protein
MYFLPTEILLHIFYFLDRQSLIKLNSTCYRHHMIISDDVSCQKIINKRLCLKKIKDLMCYPKKISDEIARCITLSDTDNVYCLLKRCSLEKKDHVIIYRDNKIERICLPDFYEYHNGFIVQQQNSMSHIKYLKDGNLRSDYTRLSGIYKNNIYFSHNMFCCNYEIPQTVYVYNENMNIIAKLIGIIHSSNLGKYGNYVVYESTVNWNRYINVFDIIKGSKIYAKSFCDDVCDCVRFKYPYLIMSIVKQNKSMVNIKIITTNINSRKKREFNVKIIKKSLDDKKLVFCGRIIGDSIFFIVIDNKNRLIDDFYRVNFIIGQIDKVFEIKDKLYNLDISETSLVTNGENGIFLYNF